MPFDGTQTAPSLRLLSEILRDQKRWPEGFEWDYGEIDKCAIGLIGRLWGRDWLWPNSCGVAELLGLPQSVSESIFLSLDKRHKTSLDKITPRRVANAIDAFLAERDAKT